MGERRVWATGMARGAEMRKGGSKGGGGSSGRAKGVRC